MKDELDKRNLSIRRRVNFFPWSLLYTDKHQHGSLVYNSRALNCPHRVERRSKSLLTSFRVPKGAILRSISILREWKVIIVPSLLSISHTNTFFSLLGSILSPFSSYICFPLHSIYELLTKRSLYAFLRVKSALYTGEHYSFPGTKYYGFRGFSFVQFTPF
jgi:hypothetical protein